MAKQGSDHPHKARSGGFCSEERENNFDFLRLLLAILVVFSHSFPLLRGHMTGVESGEPLMVASRGHVSLGEVAVDFFFVISGFLITKSWLLTRRPGDFFKKRGLRIYPAFVVAALVGLLVVGPLGCRDVPAYFRSLSVREFLAHTALLAGYNPSQVFTNLPVNSIVNGSLWTIQYEFCCYIAVALLGFVGIYRRRAVVVLAFVAAVVLYAIRERLHAPVASRGGSLLVANWDAWPRLASFYLSGMAFYLYRDRIPYSPRFAAVATAASLLSLASGKLIYLVLPTLGAYVVLYLAFNRSLRLSQVARKGDLSYGIYVYSFPLQQLLVLYFGKSLNPLTLFVLASAGSCVLAAGSWRFIESPFLRLKPTAGRHTVPNAAGDRNGRLLYAAPVAHNLPRVIVERPAAPMPLAGGVEAGG